MRECKTELLQCRVGLTLAAFQYKQVSDKHMSSNNIDVLSGCCVVS